MNLSNDDPMMKPKYIPGIAPITLNTNNLFFPLEPFEINHPKPPIIGVFINNDRPNKNKAKLNSINPKPNSIKKQGIAKIKLQIIAIFK